MQASLRALYISAVAFLTVCIAAGAFYGYSYHELMLLNRQLQMEQQMN